jgi:hypothetical protein
MPRLDAVGRYRWRGFGDDLFEMNEPPLGRFDSAYSDLTSGDFQEWQLGFELNMPIGFRRAHVAARNAELVLCRERAILRDQQREVMHEAADAIAEMDRAFTVLQTSFNRLAASHDQLKAVRTAYEADNATLDLYLEAQRRVAETETDYNLNRARYSLAIKNVHFVKGTLLDYDGVHLAEGPWPCEALEDAAKRERSRMAPRPLNYASSRAPVVSRGLFDQGVVECVPPHGIPIAPPSSAPQLSPPAPQQLEEPLPLTPSVGIQMPAAQRQVSVLSQPEVVQASHTETSPVSSPSIPPKNPFKSPSALPPVILSPGTATGTSGRSISQPPIFRALPPAGS